MANIVVSLTILTLAGLFLLALGGVLPAIGPRVSSVLACVMFGAALVMVLASAVAHT